MSAPLSIYSIIGKGYENGWWTSFKGRYRLFKGARNTKKSYDIIGVEVLDKIISDPNRNALIVRATLKANRTSTLTTLKRLIAQPDQNRPEISLRKYFRVSDHSMEITYLPTGQKIIFLGCDDPQKIASIRPEVGYLTDVYFEEAFELDDYEKFRVIDGSVRGQLPLGTFFQITLCFNAWNQDHWLYERFFKGRLEDDLARLMKEGYIDFRDDRLIPDGGYGRGLYLHTGTYKINEFRAPEYDEAMEEMRAKAPSVYRVEALGMWGNASEACYPEWRDGLAISPQEAYAKCYACYAVGIDFGVSDGQGRIDGNRLTSGNAMTLSAVASDYGSLVTVDEWFESNEGKLVKMTAPEIQTAMVAKLIEWRDKTYAAHPDLMKGRILVYVDCADSGGFRQSLELEARRQGLWEAAFVPSTKWAIASRIALDNRLMAYGARLVSERCPNLIREIRNARRGEKGKAREDIDDHAMNATEYGWAPLAPSLRMWKDFKRRP